MTEQEVKGVLDLQASTRTFIGTMSAIKGTFSEALKLSEGTVIRDEVERIVNLFDLLESEMSEVADSLQRKLIAAVSGEGRNDD